MLEAQLRVVAESPNEKGDVLTRLAGDVFHSLGYEDLLFNVPRTGREIDVLGTHRYESRRLICECKAHDEPIGGSAINKFAGVVQVERSRDARPVSAYFLSVSGFKQSALAQEREFAEPRMVLMDGQGIVAQLVTGGILLDQAKAIDQASRILPATVRATASVQMTEVVASRNGWAWGIYYGVAWNDLTHVCFVHADGQVLSRSAGLFLINDASVQLMATPDSDVDREADLAVDAYRDYILSEFGVITLEGLQADQDVGARRFRLESLYVPTRLSEQPPSSGVTGVASREIDFDDFDYDVQERFAPETQVAEEPPSTMTAGTALARHPALAILGPPGAGKSTLMKRLAVAYSSADRLDQVQDDLPAIGCVPIVVRCRQIGHTAYRAIVELLAEQIVRAEHPELKEPFGRAIGRLLRDGRILILLDGLDEIAGVQERLSFVLQLRTFLAVYPRTRLVITSREVGFRPIAGNIGELCKALYVQELSDEEITQLTVAWHRETVSASESVRNEAVRLATDICSVGRVRQLAANPLLLTTLLLVRRWVGQVPRRRSVLYGRAVDVLLMTWNVEGHAPISPEEALPQLGFVAYSMMIEGEQVVSAGRLRALLVRARAEMPDLLMHTRLSVAEMVDRIEERSSLLIQSGFEVIDGTLQAVYEFRHLTFQEYLCARAISDGWLAVGEADKSAVELIRPHLAKAGWEEVVVLTAALARRQSSAIVAALVEEASRLIERYIEDNAPSVGDLNEQIFTVVGNIADCLADDVPVAPEVLEPAIRTVIEDDLDGELAQELLGSRYEDSLRELVDRGLQRPEPLLRKYAKVYAELVASDYDDQAISLLPRQCTRMIKHRDREQRLRGLSLLLFLAWSVHNALSPGMRRRPQGVLRRSSLRVPAREVARLLASGEALDEASKMQAIWSMAWLAPLLEDSGEVNSLQQRLLKDWVAAEDGSLAAFSAWTLARTPLIGHWDDYLELDPELLDAFFRPASAGGRAIRPTEAICSVRLQLLLGDSVVTSGPRGCSCE